jgi:osmotically-inducible protein OsmY
MMAGMALAALGACGRPETDTLASRGTTQPSVQVPNTDGRTANATPSQDRASDRETGPVGSLVASQGLDASNKSRDIAISAEIKSELSKDAVLKASSIDVDTAGGNVVLRGSTPDTSVRHHAAELARSVAGVTGVDNQLLVQPRN